RAARSKANLKVRQPLAKVLVKARSQAEREALERLKPQVLDELNVKDMAFVADDSEVVNYDVKPNFSRLGPKYGGQVRQAVAALTAADPNAVAQKALAGLAFVTDGFEFGPEDMAVTASNKPGLAVASEGGYTVALTTEVTPELAAEGLAREIVHRLQMMRRSAGFDIADYIVTYYRGAPEIAKVMRDHAPYIRQETLSRELVEGESPPQAYTERHQVDGYELVLGVRKEQA
ncbi:MAG: isoleucine--tRNA ligase, partial [Chloroflexi bacterium]|nr:isoleucine--tRNA ligase [Chloroflexota bacterium]